ncbi:MAG TPA: hypothetical protein VLE49_22595 [Anaerolineales bacterium]|nr:hypothetical protein [Anaerolineales bacterium]
MYFVKYRLPAMGLIAALVVLTNSCSGIPRTDKTGPAIENITTSSKVLAKSDCIPTSLTITSDVTDSGGVESVTLWYRVGQGQDFTSTTMTRMDRNQYTATIKALDIPGGEYGVFEFYIVAQDKTGGRTQSSTDKSVELTRCVG